MIHLGATVGRKTQVCILIYANLEKRSCKSAPLPLNLTEEHRAACAINGPRVLHHAHSFPRDVWPHSPIPSAAVRPTCWSLFRLCENMSVALALFSTECRAICLTHSILPPFVTNVAQRDRASVRNRGCVIRFASPFKNSRGTLVWFGLPTWAGQMAPGLV